MLLPVLCVCGGAGGGEGVKFHFRTNLPPIHFNRFLFYENLTLKRPLTTATF